jgi:carbon-monoxide dehydrogenase small subunit
VENVPLCLQLNHRAITLHVAPSLLLIDMLREECQLTGTHQGCDTAQCGACTVLVDGQAIKSCNRLALQCANQSVLTIEGVAPNAHELHVMQQCFSQHHALQCGFCTTGMVMSAIDLCTHHPKADAGEIRALLEGNICRCTGYQNIVKSVQQGQAAMAVA